MPRLYIYSARLGHVKSLGSRVKRFRIHTEDDKEPLQDLKQGSDTIRW